VAEEDLTIRASVDAAGVQTGAAQAIASFQAMQAAATATAASVASITPAANTAAAGLAGIAPAATQAATAVGGIGPAATTAATGLGGIAPAAQQAATGMGGLRVATAGSLREFIILGHEVVVGNFSRIPGSLLVLGERVGGLGTLLAGVSGSTIALGAAGLAAAGGLAYLAYQEYQTEQSIAHMQGTLLAQGRGFEESTTSLRKFVDTLKESTGLWSGTARAVAGDFGALPPEIAGQRDALAKQLVEFAQATGRDVTKFAKEAGHDLGTVSGAMKLLEETTGPATVALKEQVSIYEKAGEPAKALVAIIDQLLERLSATTGAVQDQKKAWDDYKAAIAGVTQSAEDAMAAQSATRGINPPDVPATKDRDRQAEAMRHFMSQAGGGYTQAQAAGIVGTLTQESGPGLSTTMTNASGHTGIAQWSIERQKALGISATSSREEQLAAITRELATTESAAGAKIRAATTPAAAAAGMATFERPEGYGGTPNEQLYGGKHVAAAQQLAGMAGRQDPAAADAERVTDKLLKTKQQIAVLDEQIATLEAIPNRSADQENALLTARLERQKQVSPLMKEELETRKAVLEQQKLSATSDQQRLTIQRQINQIEDQLKGGTASSAARQAFADAQAQKVADDDAQRAKIIGLQTQLAQTSDLRQQLELKKQIAAAEQQLTRGSQVGGATAAKAVAEAEKQYSQESIRDEERAIDSKVRIDQSALGLRKAQLAEEVALHQRTQASEAAEVLKATDQMARAEEQLYQNIVNRSDATVQQKERAYERIAEVATRTAEAEIREQERVAKEIQKDAQASAKAYISGFDSAGSSLENFFNGAVTGANRSRDAVKQLGQSLEKDLLTSIERLVSQQAAKGLGSLFGIQTKEGSGLGDLLGSAVSKGIGSIGGGSSDAQSSQTDLAKAAQDASSQLTLAATAQQKLNELLGISGTVTTAATTAKGLESTAVAAHEVVTTTDTAAVAANASAQAASAATGAAGAATSAAGGFLKAIPIIGGIASLLGFSRGGIVSAAGGMVLPGLGSGGVLARLHSNEMVLPANISQGLQSMIAGGGGASPPVNAIFNVSAIDSQDVAKFFRSNGGALVAGLNSAMRNGSNLKISQY
jgi:hypothetical protein